MSKLSLLALALLAACSAADPSGSRAAPSAKGGSALDWMGVYGEHERHSGGNPGTFTVLMSQDYVGLHAELGLQVDGGEWELLPMSWMGNVDGNSLWQVEPVDAFPGGSELSYFFHGYDDWGREIWDSAGGANYSFTVPSGYAEDYLEPIDRGFWADEDCEGTVRGYIDFAVQGWADDKMLAMRTQVARENGVVEEYLYHLEHEGTESDGRERWGTDLLELYPDSAHHGAITSVEFTFQAQVDQLLVSEHSYLLATPDQLASPATGLGVPAASGTNSDDGQRDVGTSLADDVGASLPELELYFSPYDDPEQAVIAEIEAVAATQRADPGGQHSIHASVFDINDSRITDALLEAHAAGVQIQLLTAGYHTEPWRDWETQYPRLQQAGVPLLGVVRDEDIAASMHTKFAVFDGQVVTTGSYNWESLSADDNAEDMLLIRSAELAAVYERMFAGIAAEPFEPWPADSGAPIQVYYSQEHELAEVICRELDAAASDVQLAMFTLRSMSFSDDSGVEQDVLDALVAAVDRGVAVRVLLESNISDEGEYYGTITADDGTDEWLQEQGVEVIEISIDDASSEYASMHHKFAVIDGQIALLGSANWSSMSQVSDDDLVVIHDADLAQALLGEITNLRRHYQADFDADTAPATAVEFAVYHPYTSYGDTVHLVGSIPELGEWEPSGAIAMDPSGWPWWTATVQIPAGTHFEYKHLVTGGGGTSWESGDNRAHTADPSGETDPVSATYGS